MSKNIMNYSCLTVLQLALAFLMSFDFYEVDLKYLKLISHFPLHFDVYQLVLLKLSQRFDVLLMSDRHSRMTMVR